MNLEKIINNNLTRLNNSLVLLLGVYVSVLVIAVYHFYVLVQL